MLQTWEREMFIMPLLLKGFGREYLDSLSDNKLERLYSERVLLSGKDTVKAD